MFTKVILPILAVAGVVWAVLFVRAGSKPIPASQPVAEPAHAPFESYIAGAGLVEASTENISIGTIVPGVVTDLFVKVGDNVKAGDPLFKVDDRDLQAELIVRKSALASAKEKLSRLQNLPRPEDIPPAEAKVAEAKAQLADAKDQLETWQSVPDKRAVSAEDVNRKKFAVDAADARLKQAEAALALLKAGSWKPDIEIAKADVAAAEAQVQATQTEVDRRTVRAPVAGQILQVKIRLGEYAPAGVLAQPLMLMGDVNTLVVRVDIDENDAWRLKNDQPARAYLRGNSELWTDVKFVRVEPYVIPKRSLTGESTERVDTRVLQVLYSFNRGALPVYVGQQMDVFIEAPPARVGATAAAIQ
jgi:multidrug efflux pump subunit AcrA (membrane-fusion protein)